MKVELSPGSAGGSPRLWGRGLGGGRFVSARSTPGLVPLMDTLGVGRYAAALRRVAQDLAGNSTNRLGASKKTSQGDPIRDSVYPDRPGPRSPPSACCRSHSHSAPSPTSEPPRVLRDSEPIGAPGFPRAACVAAGGCSVAASLPVQLWGDVTALGRSMAPPGRGARHRGSPRRPAPPGKPRDATRPVLSRLCVTAAAYHASALRVPMQGPPGA